MSLKYLLAAAPALNERKLLQHRTSSSDSQSRAFRIDGHGRLDQLRPSTMKMKFAAAVAALASTFATSAYAQYTSLAPANYGLNTYSSASSNYTALYSYSPLYVDTAAHVNADLYNFVNYDYEIVGPANESVPITLTYNLSTFASGYAAIAFAAIEGQSNTGFVMTACSSTQIYDCGAVKSSVDVGSINLTVDSNAAYLVELYSQAEAYYNGIGLPSSAQAFADPVITIDAPGYTLELSPGVSNGLVSAAPEPSAWAFMLLGIATVGGALRTRRREFSSLASAWPPSISQLFGLSTLQEHGVMKIKFTPAVAVARRYHLDLTASTVKNACHPAATP